MAGRAFGEEFAGELAAKGFMWGSSIAGAIVAGPAGAVVGLAASVAILAAASKSSPPGGDQAPRGQNGASK